MVPVQVPLILADPLDLCRTRVLVSEHVWEQHFFVVSLDLCITPALVSKHANMLGKIMGRLQSLSMHAMLILHVHMLPMGLPSLLE